MRIAVIDMGTNIFNMLVAEVGNNHNFEIVHKLKLPVQLGEGGFASHIIPPAAWHRGLDAIAQQLECAQTFGAEKFYAFATSATRDAHNGKNFANEIQQKFNLKVEIIDGNREATLIYKGIRQSIELGGSNNLILDIGGGSNEIIIANNSEAKWLHSFNLGVLRLNQMFNTSDPITDTELEQVEAYITTELKMLFDAAQELLPTRLVGSSGLFDSIRDIMQCNGTIPNSNNTYAQLPIDAFHELHKQILKMDLSQRLRIKGLNPIRANYILLASVFVEILLKHINIEQMYQSSYSLKEGFIAELTESAGKEASFL